MSMIIRIATSNDVVYAAKICEWYIISSKERGTGIARRTKDYISQKMIKGDAIIAIKDSEILGFCYIESFEGAKYVSNSGLIVGKEFRGLGLSKKIKKAAVDLARLRYPSSKIFGITTSDIVMKINSDLGYIPVSFTQLTSDMTFWNGCQSCKNYDILLRNDCKMCLCTGMLAPSGDEIKIDLTNLINNENNK